MPLKPSRFTLDEAISVAGRRLLVTGITQFEDAQGALITRYRLADGAGAGAMQIMEARGEDVYAFLRPFPSAAQPPAVEGGQMTIMGVKYALGPVGKLKLVGAEGAPVAEAAPAPAMLVSGRFEGASGAILREIVPGPGTQLLYHVKPVAASELMTAAQAATAAHLAERFREEQAAAQAAEARESASGWRGKIKGWMIALVVFAIFAYACSDSDSDESAGSARGVVVHGSSFHGK